MNGKRVAIALAAAGLLAAVGCGDEGESSAPDALGTWERLPDAPLSPREGALGLWTGTEALVIGGSDAPPCPPSADCEVPRVPPLADGAAIEPGAGDWRRIATAPTAIAGASGVVLGRTAYVWVHGDPRRPGLERAFLAYDIDADRWERLPLPPVGDQLHVLTATDEEVVLFRGSDEYGESPDLAFDPRSERWRALPPDPLSPAFDRALAWNGEELVLIAKDRAGLGAEEPLFVSAAAINPRLGSWRELPDSEVLDMGQTGCWVAVGDRIVNPSIGSNDAGGRWDRAYPDGGVLDPETGEWSDLPKRPEDVGEERYGGGILTESGAFCMTTGGGWALDATANQWLAIPPLDDGLVGGRTIVGTENGALAFGGADYSGSPNGRLTQRAWLLAPR